MQPGVGGDGGPETSRPIVCRLSLFCAFDAISQPAFHPRRILMATLLPNVFKFYIENYQRLECKAAVERPLAKLPFNLSSDRMLLTCVN